MSSARTTPPVMSTEAAKLRRLQAPAGYRDENLLQRQMRHAFGLGDGGTHGGLGLGEVGDDAGLQTARAQMPDTQARAPGGLRLFAPADRAPQ